MAWLSVAIHARVRSGGSSGSVGLPLSSDYKTGFASATNHYWNRAALLYSARLGSLLHGLSVGGNFTVILLCVVPQLQSRDGRKQNGCLEAPATAYARGLPCFVMGLS